MSEILTGKLRMKLFDLLNKEDYEVLNKKSVNAKFANFPILRLTRAKV